MKELNFTCVRKFLLLLLCCFSTVLQGVAQNFPDTIRNLYSAAPDMREKHRQLRDYFAYSLPYDPGEKVKQITAFRNELLRRGDQSGADFMGVLTAVQAWRAGDYSSAITTCMNLLPALEARKDTMGILNALNTIGIGYADSKNHDQSVLYLKRAFLYTNEGRDPSTRVTILNNLADDYLKMGQRDSALTYILQAQQLAEWHGKAFLLTLVYSTMGEVYMLSGDEEIALPVLRKAVTEAMKDEDTATISYNYSNMAECHNRLLRSDSAIWYASRAYELALPGLLAEMLKSSECLTRYYRAANVRDSLYRYFQIAMDIKDSLFAIEKTRTIQQLHFSEQLREEEKTIQAAAAQRERKQHLQLMALAIFVVTFLMFVFLLKRRKPTLRTIEWMGMLAVLLLFEFVSMLLHPMLERLTHHNPFLMLLCLVLIGAIIAPLHHKMTELLKRKMST